MDKSPEAGKSAGTRRRQQLDYAISRCTPPGTAPYLECSFERNACEYRKGFPLTAFASEAEALAAARRWRDEMLASVRPMTRAEYARQIRSNNQSGVSGVLRMVQTQKKRNGKRYTYEVWVAVTPKGTVPSKTRVFSIKRYGEHEAFARAVAAREEFLTKLSGYKLNNVPDEFADCYKPAASDKARP